jgi:magnesium-protoporphyrin IX monomethyl ester (oxidative) cyclase
VFRITSEIARQVFPIEIDIDHPVFRAGLDKLLKYAIEDARAREQGGLVGTLKRGYWITRAFLTFGRLYLLPVKHQALPEQVRLQPTW